MASRLRSLLTLANGELSQSPALRELLFEAITDEGIDVAGLQAEIDAETVSRIAEDTNLQNEITTEVADRTSADLALAAEDVNLQGQITAEVAARAAADTNLQNEINTLQFGALTHAVRAATTGSIANLAAASVVQDSVALVQGDRLLVKDQSGANQKQNGIYIVGVVAAGVAPLTRAADFDDAQEVVPEALVGVSEGTVANNTYWVLSTPAPITVGTTALIFVQFGNPSTTTPTNVSSAAAGAVGVSRLYARADHVHTIVSPEQTALDFTTAANLASYSMAGVTADRLAFCQTFQDYFTYDASGALAPQPNVVIAGNLGTGNWVRNFNPSLIWRYQANWYINPVGGDDRSKGDAPGAAIKTFAEYFRRTGYDRFAQIPSGVTSTINLLGNIPSTDPVMFAVQGGGPSSGAIIIKGALTAQTAITISANTARITGTNPADITAAAWTVTNELKRIVAIDSNDAYAIVAKDMGGGTARVSPWTVSPSTLDTGPLAIVADPTVFWAANPGNVAAHTYTHTYTIDRFGGIFVGRDGETSQNFFMMADVKLAPSGGAVNVVSALNGTVPIFMRCNVGNLRIQSGQLWSLGNLQDVSSTVAGDVEGGGMYFILQSLVTLAGSFLRSRKGGIISSDGDTLWQNAQCLVQNNGFMQLGRSMHFDCTIDQIMVSGSCQGRVRNLGYGTAAVCGDTASAVYGFKSNGLTYYDAKPTVTGNTGALAANVGGTAKTWAAIPYAETTNTLACISATV